MSGDKKETAGERKMKVLGITGGVGAGKSTVLGYLAKRYGADGNKYRTKIVG